ncbi:MAG: aspartate-semialdehyde dehydrogenase [Gammaproteobacteria bacterium]|nr:aspartate-semialdehyde dehydrogenase [Gammaproteobacteria bacterium]
MSELFDIAVIGAAGTVGETMIEFLQERHFPVGKLYPLDHASSASEPISGRVQFNSHYLPINDVAQFDFSQVSIALFAKDAVVSAEFAPKAAEAGCVVLDSSSCFRADDDVPLVIPEVNAAALAGFRGRNIIATPGCSTIQMWMALKPVYDAVGIERINVATYQAVSGAGQKAVEGLAGQTVALLSMKDVVNDIFPKQMAFNVLPSIGAVEENGYTHEEMKMVWESQKILGDDAIVLNPTAVRVPVFFGHAQALHVETREKIDAADVRELLAQAPGVKVMDSSDTGGYPTSVTEATGSDAVHVGRIRNDISHPCGLDMWVVTDNVRKGAALNTVQIVELLVKNYL